MQFERRFVELFELVQQKLSETRKYYAMYNTLEQSHSFMKNEVLFRIYRPLLLLAFLLSLLIMFWRKKIAGKSFGLRH